MVTAGLRKWTAGPIHIHVDRLEPAARLPQDDSCGYTEAGIIQSTHEPYSQDICSRKFSGK